MELDISTQPESDPGGWYPIHSAPDGTPIVEFRIRAVPADFRRWRDRIRMKAVGNGLDAATSQEALTQFGLDTAVYSLAEIRAADGFGVRIKDAAGAKAYSKASGSTVAVGDLVNLCCEFSNPPANDPRVLCLKRQFLMDKPQYAVRVNAIAADAEADLVKLEKKGT